MEYRYKTVYYEVWVPNSYSHYDRPSLNSRLEIKNDSLDIQDSNDSHIQVNAYETRSYGLYYIEKGCMAKKAW